MVYAQPSIYPGEWRTQIDIQTDHLISAWRPALMIINKKKKRIWKIVDFAIPADHKVKLKESEKKNKNLDITTELKKNRATW